MIVFYKADTLAIFHCVFDPIPPAYALWVQEENTDPYLYLPSNYAMDDMYLARNSEDVVEPFLKIVMSPTYASPVIAGEDFNIEGLVVPCKLDYEGATYDITENPLTLNFENPGEHNLRFYDFDKKDIHIKIQAVEE